MRAEQALAGVPAPVQTPPLTTLLREGSASASERPALGAPSAVLSPAAPPASAAALPSSASDTGPSPASGAPSAATAASNAAHLAAARLALAALEACMRVATEVVQRVAHVGGAQAQAAQHANECGQHGALAMPGGH
jgi:hypothetical protein